jgi:hypothetical protein
MEDFTPRNAAKFVVKAIVHSKVKHIAEDVITDYTRFEEDDVVVDISSHMIGWYVSSKLRPITDKMVDKTADFITAKREEMKAKQDKPEEQ